MSEQSNNSRQQRLQESRAARDRQIQEEIDNPNTSETRRQQLLRLQRRREREGRTSSSTMNTLDNLPPRPRHARRSASQGTSDSEWLRGFFGNRTRSPAIPETETLEQTPAIAPTDSEPPRLRRSPAMSNLDDVTNESAREGVYIPSESAWISTEIPLGRVPPSSPSDTELESNSESVTNTEFEEDSETYDSVTLSDNVTEEYITDEDVDGSCSATGSDVEGGLSKERDFFRKNCTVCRSHITLDDFSEEDYNDIVSVKVFDMDNMSFGKGHCIPKSDLEGMLRSDLGAEYPKYIFSLYKKTPDARSEGTLAGLGTAPSNQFVVQLNIGALSIFVTLGSIHKLMNTKDKILYAAPLYGGKRRRLGNIPGRLTIIGANHGQVPGFRIYKLFTRDEINSGVDVAAGETDFILPLRICRNIDEIVGLFSDTSKIRRVVMDELIEHLLTPVKVQRRGTTLID